MFADYQGRMLGQQHYGDGGGVMLASIPTRGVVTIYSRIGEFVRLSERRLTDPSRRLGAGAETVSRRWPRDLGVGFAPCPQFKFQ